jgi:hypothetical protein
MSRIDEQIAGLEEKLKQLKARQQKTIARQRTVESQKVRKADTRRKILIGAIVLARMKQGRLRQDEVRGWLNEALTRPDDRALFDLTPPQTAPTEQIGLGLPKSP